MSRNATPANAARRESGKMPITREAWLALLSLSKKMARAKRPNDKLTDSRP